MKIPAYGNIPAVTLKIIKTPRKDLIKIIDKINKNEKYENNKVTKKISVSKNKINPNTSDTGVLSSVVMLISSGAALILSRKN